MPVVNRYDVRNTKWAPYLLSIRKCSIKGIPRGSIAPDGLCAAGFLTFLEDNSIGAAGINQARTLVKLVDGSGHKDQCYHLGCETTAHGGIKL